jgi:5-methyltetrahydropteroyltriglutamate--homocysteine methyltransferase
MEPFHSFSESIPTSPTILAVMVGAYPAPAWLGKNTAYPDVVDALRIVFGIQREAGLDVLSDGDLGRYNPDYPDADGLVEHFVRPLAGIRQALGRQDWERFSHRFFMRYRHHPAGVVTGPLGEGSMNLLVECQRSAQCACGPLMFSIASPYQLARTVLDDHYGDFELLVMAFAEVLAAQVRGLPCSCLQIVDANIPGNPAEAALAAAAINRVFRDVRVERAAHFYFGNYEGQPFQKEQWQFILDVVNNLDVDHVMLEMSDQPSRHLEALRGVSADASFGIGVIDAKSNLIEPPDIVASRLDRACRVLGPERVRWAMPDSGLWMLKRSVAERKLHALVAGRDKFLGR